MLPVHPQPEKDELLSSWMVRLAFNNGFFQHTFYSSLMGYQLPIWNIDLDRHQPYGLLDLLAEQTGQSIDTLQSLTLSDYQGYLFDSVTVNGNSRWIMPLGIYHRQHKRPGLQFCPQCLEEGAYYRKHWRLALFAMCEKHECLLYEKCPKCAALVMFHRNGIGKRRELIPERGIEYCFKCQLDFKDIPSRYCEYADGELIESYISLIRNFQSGIWSLDGNILPCAPPFYSGLYFIIGAILGRRGHLVRRKIKNDIGIDLHFVERRRERAVEYLCNNDRVRILLAITWLVEQWPHRFIEFCLETGITRSSFFDHIRDLPFWLLKVVNIDLEHRSYIPTRVEMISAGEYIERKRLPLIADTFSEVMGISRDVARAALRAYRER